MSLAGLKNGVALFDAFRGQVEKLAAVYAMQDGLSANKAAQQAAEDVVNFRYIFQDGYRIPGPKDLNPAQESAADIRVGASVAQMNIGGTAHGIDLRIKPFMDTFSNVYTPEQLASETAHAKRTGRWATTGDDKGLWYVYKGQVAKKPDGTPLQLTWKQLADIGKKVNEGMAYAPPSGVWEGPPLIEPATGGPAVPSPLYPAPRPLPREGMAGTPSGPPGPAARK